jgi:hypothetical protein
MATPACPHCECTGFELQDAQDIAGSNFAYSIVRCSGCGAPIGVLEDENTSAILAEHAAKLEDLSDGVARLEVAMKNALAELRDLRREMKK